jgi:hypothetical protein
MKHLKSFNESVFEGEDFLYKEISVREYRELELERDRVVPDEITMDKIYDLLLERLDESPQAPWIWPIDKSLILDDTKFYQFTIIHEDEDNLYIIPLEDDWYLVEFQESEWSQDEVRGGYSIDKHFYVCDGWEGLVKFIEDKI